MNKGRYSTKMAWLSGFPSQNMIRIRWQYLKIWQAVS